MRYIPEMTWILLRHCSYTKNIVLTQLMKLLRDVLVTSTPLPCMSSTLSLRYLRFSLEECQRSHCFKWEVKDHQISSLLLVMTVGCRMGEIRRCRGHAGDGYLQWRHIILRREKDSAPQLFDLIVQIVFNY